jgi:hypothetical protein
VHGNESSSSEAAMWTAWDLARDAPEVAGVLDSLVVIIDPVANPDGRDRYVQWFNSVVGARPNPNPQAREHREPWPGGRFNHYLFDLNRDWAWGTQPETRARLATWWVWNPQVHVDFHEMGYNSTYFFFPAAAPINPIYPDTSWSGAGASARANAAAFDQRGWPYYTGEAFDLFYPGYGDSWPSLTGAIGMTYEQAGHGRPAARSRGVGRHAHAAPAGEQHRTAGHATLRTAAFGKTRAADRLRGGAARHRARRCRTCCWCRAATPPAWTRWSSTCAGRASRWSARAERSARRERLPRLRHPRGVPGGHLPGAHAAAARPPRGHAAAAGDRAARGVLVRHQRLVAAVRLRGGGPQHARAPERGLAGGAVGRRRA